ncbi:type VII secretion integral membrane protein EccD [Mycobacterium sp. MYCO198283]|uniref:type VII secretion integral membrane protein EccD n=1 Tax=Mycobacterium sp. MYCO198283 TaxID=2883505 RepID=UPI001E6040B2|nr:type VII secretion integral membrane protein EccD [Mycobacterium sp. MYCO198283]MCG5431810.1 type VII secretion integral membrane protein EccD [Mycobacterium sp. MYCO198283]
MTIAHGATAVDLALPAGVPVVELLPPIVDMLHRRPGAPRWQAGGRWQLSRPGQPPLNVFATLAGSAVADGELLVLDTAAQHHRGPVFDAVAETVARASTRAFDEHSARRLADMAAVLFTALSAVVTVIAAGRQPDPGLAVAPAVFAITSLAAAGVARRRCGTPIAVLPWCSVVFAGAAGATAVPGSPGSAHAVLAAVAAGCAAVVAARLRELSAVAALAVVMTAGAIAAAAALDTSIGVPWRSSAPVVAIGGVLLLAAAPAMALRAGGTPLPTAHPVTPPDAELATAAARTRTLFTGLVCGAAATAAAGSGLTVLTADGHLAAMLCGATVSAALLLRSRSHTDAVQRIAVTAAGGAPAVVLAGTALPAPWAAVAAGVAAAGALALGYLRSAPVTPVGRRAVDLVEYAAVAVAVPIAWWAAGVFDALLRLDVR